MNAWVRSIVVSTNIATSCCLSSAGNHGVPPAEGVAQSDSPKCNKPEWTESRRVLERHIDQGSAKAVTGVDNGRLSAKAHAYVRARMGRSLNEVLGFMPELGATARREVADVYGTTLAHESIIGQLATFVDLSVSDHATNDQFVVLTIVYRLTPSRCYEDVLLSRWRKIGGDWFLEPDLPHIVR